MTVFLNKKSWRLPIRQRRIATASVILGLIMLLTGVAAEAQHGAFSAKYAGAVTTTEIDIDLDEEETARVFTGVGRGTLIGPFVFHEIRESDILEPGHPENACGEGEQELIDIHWTLVMTDQRGDSQLYFQLAEDQPHVFCLDPNNPPMGGGFRIHDLEIIGGTERFEGASGRVTVECRGRALAPGDPAGGPAHGAVSCKLDGYLEY